MLSYELWHSLVVQLNVRLIGTSSHAAATTTQSTIYHTRYRGRIAVCQGLVAGSCEAFCVWPTSLMHVV